MIPGTSRPAGALPHGFELTVICTNIGLTCLDLEKETLEIRAILSRRFETPPYERDTETIVGRVPPEEIGYVGALIESYEGIGIVRTRDPQAGIIEFWIIPEFRSVFDEVLGSLREEIEVEILNIPPARRL